MLFLIFEFQQELELARKVSIELLDTLRQILLYEMGKGGPLNAIKVCSNMAQDIPKFYRERYGLFIRRISEKYRNEADKPDNYEEKILIMLDSLNKQNKLPEEYYEVIKEGDKNYLRYFKPITVQGMCLVCHGTEDYIPKDIKEFLNKAYPSDRARGYKVGDFRGAVSVKILLKGGEK
jgi:hypothetical protein